jgi:glyoxylase-like metal-dependent hydrolase (beta-lactamase superfamily II)
LNHRERELDSILQIFDGVFLLQGEVGGRPISLPLLAGDCALLLDTGCAFHVPQLILPALKSLGIGPDRLRWIINTHCDMDHQGGNHAMKAFAPRATLCCGDADRSLIEDPETLFARRYDAYRPRHHHFYDDATRRSILEASGHRQPVDLTFAGGERTRLAPDWELEVLSLPGHSHGHLGILDHRHRAVYGGDAIHGASYLDVSGQPALCPTYLHVQPYLGTIRFIEHLDIDSYVGCHWPVKRGAQIQEFCRESRVFVETAERLVLQTLNERSASLNELCETLSSKLGAWPQATSTELAYAINGHLDDLETRSLIAQVPQTSPSRYRVGGA